MTEGWPDPKALHCKGQGILKGVGLLLAARIDNRPHWEEQVYDAGRGDKSGCSRVPVRGAMPRIQNEDPAIDPVPIVLSSNENRRCVRERVQTGIKSL